MFRFQYPTALVEKKYEIRALRAGVTEKLGGLEFSSRFQNKQIRFDIKGAGPLLKHLSMFFFPMDQNGRFMGPFSVGTSHTFTGTGNTISGNMNYSISLNKMDQMDQKPEEIKFKLLTAFDTIEYPFEIPRIRLASHVKKPTGPIPINFGNRKEPVSVAFRNFDRTNPSFPKARLELKNHANKGILKIEADFHYLDATGRPLKTYPHQIKGVFTEHSQNPVVGKNSETAVDTTVFFLPENTTDIDIRIKSVEFDDYSRWTSGE
jgi:hypothetical protein